MDKPKQQSTTHQRHYKAQKLLEIALPVQTLLQEAVAIATSTSMQQMVEGPKQLKDRISVC